jgi:hypothetical protein
MVTTDLKKPRVRKFIDEEDEVKMELNLTSSRPSQSTESKTPVQNEKINQRKSSGFDLTFFPLDQSPQFVT